MRHLHFGIEIIFHRRKVYIFAELTVQRCPGDPGGINDIAKCYIFFNVLMDEFERPLKSGGAVGCNILY